MKELVIKLLKVLGLYKLNEVPQYIKAKFLYLDKANAEKLDKGVKEYFKTDLNAEDIEENLTSHNFGRLENFRSRHIYFLDKLIGLKGKKVLEIGCGTGSSSIALAEQEATVYGLDVDDKSLILAKERTELYGLTDKIELKKGNATEIDQIYQHDFFDIVIFFASIEHMTYDERIDSLKAAWKVLKKGGALCILGTPNRLWMFDSHTSYLPFYDWLPDELAYKYTQFSTRQYFNKLYKRDFNATREEFARWGRGVSYHELELAIKHITEIPVIGDLHSFERPKTLIQKLAYKRTDEYKYKQILANQGPKGLDMGFYEYYLDIAVRKT